jgi:hypothetical protein
MPLKIAALVVAACAMASLGHAESTFSADAGVFHDNNLTRAQPSADMRADSAARFGAQAGQFFAPTGADTVDIAAFARGEVYRRYHGLDNAVAGASAALRHKFGLGYGAPWLRLSLEGTHDDYDDTLRDGNRLSFEAEIGMRCTPALDIAGGLVYDRRYDSHGESVVPGIPGTVFDLRGFGGFARAGYAFSDIVYGALRLGVRRGDVESTAQQSLPIFLASSAIAADPVFGSDDLFAYRLRGTTWSGATTASIALAPGASVNISYADERTYSPYGNQYKNRVVTLLLAYRP